MAIFNSILTGFIYRGQPSKGKSYGTEYDTVMAIYQL